MPFREFLKQYFKFCNFALMFVNNSINAFNIKVKFDCSNNNYVTHLPVTSAHSRSVPFMTMFFLRVLDRSSGSPPLPVPCDTPDSRSCHHCPIGSSVFCLIHRGTSPVNFILHFRQSGKRFLWRVVSLTL